MTVCFDFRPPPKALNTKLGKIGVWSLQENWTKSREFMLCASPYNLLGKATCSFLIFFLIFFQL